MNIEEYINKADFSIRKKSESSLFNEYELDKWQSFEKFIDTKCEIKSLCDYSTAVDDWTLESYSKNTLHPACLDGKVQLIARKELISQNYKLIFNGLSFVRKRYNFECVIELGSGLGNNLIFLHAAYPNINFISREYSKTARRLQSRFLLPYIKNLQIGEFNLYSIRNDLHFEKSVIFTSFVFSLVKHFPEKILDDLIGSGAKYVVNIEPLYEIQDENVKLDAKIKKYIRSNDYNLDYYQKLLNYEKIGRIKILEYQKNNFGINAFFPASMVIWEICGED